MHFDLWYEAFIFIGIFAFLIFLPCVGVAIIGFKMIQKLGHHPSKTPAIQTSIILQLVVTEVISFALILVFYKIFSQANN